MRLYYLDVTEIPCHIILLLYIGKLKLMEISCNASQNGFRNSFWIFFKLWTRVCGSHDVTRCGCNKYVVAYKHVCYQ